MNTDELRAAYPAAADVVEFVEGEDCHQRGIALGTANGMTLREIVELLRETFEQTVGKSNDPDREEFRRQLQHQDFVRYVAAKMGAM